MTEAAGSPAWSAWPRARDGLAGACYRVMVGVALAGIVAPMLVVVFSSFSDTLYFSFPPRGVSLVAYRRFWANPTLRDALRFSAAVGAATMVCSLALAAPAAYAIDRFRFRGRNLIHAFLMLPIMLPVLMVAIALVMLVNVLHVPRHPALLVASHVFVAVPFALRVLVAAFAGLDRQIEEASASLGARPLETLRRVTLPLLQPGFLAAAVLAFVMSFGHITMSLFLTGEGMTTLPVEIFLIADFSYDVAITAVSVIVLAVALVIVVVVERTTGLERVI
ncbi:MAG: ABC transporter permease [Candidatus Rokubacteria bacterium]|nr:ABC transporter permease [Candidatus Rokubacteria bacterium]